MKIDQAFWRNDKSSQSKQFKLNYLSVYKLYDEKKLTHAGENDRHVADLISLKTAEQSEN